MDEVVAFVFQEYEVAPDAVRIAEFPAQMLDPDTDKVGVALTRTVAWVELPHPAPEFPITEYTTVAEGETTMLERFDELLHE
jgi:hypothetical protein